ncbi:type II secretion system protein N [Sphingobium subterraneum]|uniref:Type II secretion system protein N n=1 Tax=Sphingobium subterraneum TaxID=627688 RepID=A0A841IZJ9_9SPHN|nr:type II secretion system protein N [Sphingobium subterraneum]MBB6122696.1 general secretion pathway protein N [Sphingobium subterraneum]
MKSLTGSMRMSRRGRIGLIVVFVLALVLLFPLRLAVMLSGLDDRGVSASQVNGSVWGGMFGDLMLGNVRIGNVYAALSPVQLVVARIRMDIWRENETAGSLKGAMTVGFNARGIDDVTGRVPVGLAFAPLPVSNLEMEKVTVHFAAESCAKAGGRVRARLASSIAGLNLTQGMSGIAQCDGQAVLFPLVSQTGLERLSLRIWRDGRTSAQMLVRSGDGVNAAALEAMGFRRSGGNHVLTVSGAL